MTQRKNQDHHYHALAVTHGAAMMRLARSSEADADKRLDLLQLMHVEVWKSLVHFNGACSEKTWVYRVIHNVAASYVAKETRYNGPMVQDDISDQLPSCNDTLGAFEKRDALEKIYIWIRRLTMPDRQILLLYLEDVSAFDIADTVGLTSGAVATRISRLKTQLTASFKDL